MYEQVIFYNHFGAGDIYESREFVKEWINLVPSKAYFYAHGKNPRIILDIPQIKFKEITEHMNPIRGVWDDRNGNLYVNTWIGRDSKYVLPGIGCTLEKLHQMHNDMLKVYNLGKLREDVTTYIPDIDYSFYDIDECNNFIKMHPEEKIFIDNGLVQSKQAENFPFHNIILKLANNHKDKCFIVTHELPFQIDNVYPTSYITKNKFGFDLPEVSYISTFCSTLIGRNSGPHVHTQNKINVFDKNKKLVSFTHHQQGASFIVNTNVSIQKFWHSSSDSEEGILRKIEEIIG